MNREVETHASPMVATFEVLSEPRRRLILPPVSPHRRVLRPGGPGGGPHRSPAAHPPGRGPSPL